MELNRFTFQCVFFSRISLEKGADVVLEVASRLPDVGFSFYGQVDKAFKSYFQTQCAALHNVSYKGVFDSVEEDPVMELAKYDLHLFPTRWPHEGIPGVLVETKIAAVPSIVSDICYNAEIVRDGEEGVVLKECSADELAKAIDRLRKGSSLLQKLKRGALKSSERYYIDRYIDAIVADLSR